jgi:hypothetical protein
LDCPPFELPITNNFVYVTFSNYNQVWLDVSKRGIRDESTKKMKIYTIDKNSTKNMPFERK